MNREKAIELLRKDLEGYKLRLKIEKIEENRKHFSEKIEALEMAISELKRTTPKDLRKLSEQLKVEVRNGTKTLNQARKEFGLKPAKGGDVLSVTFKEYM